MILVLIPIAWLAVATVVVAACRMAARSDATAAEPTPERSRRTVVFPGLTVSEPRDPVQLRRLALTLAYGSHGDAGHLGARPGLAADGFRVRGVRGRGGRCAAGS
jgi:hypothetical protein